MTPFSRINQGAPTGSAAPLSAPPAPAGVAPRRPGQPSRRTNDTMTTSTVLAWWRIVVVLACLGAAVIAPMVLNQNRQSLERVNDATQQLLLLETVRSDVMRAEAAATQALLLAGNSGQVDQSYLGLIGSAATGITQAAAASPAVDARLLSEANSALMRYTAQLAVAMETGQRDAMVQASDQLHAKVLPLLDDRIEINLLRLDYSTADQRWLSLLVAVPIVLIVAASIIVARRTRRVFNIGLLVGLAAAIGTWLIVTQVVTTSAESVSAVQTSGVSQATAIAQTYAAVTEAKAAEGRVLLGVTPASEGNQIYQDATGRATTALEQLPDAAGALDQLKQMTATHDQLMSASETNRATQLAAAQAPYNGLVAWLVQQSEQVGSSLDQQLTDHAQTVQHSLGGVAVTMLIAAFATGIGLSQPLRRYR